MNSNCVWREQTARQLTNENASRGEKVSERDERGGREREREREMAMTAYARRTNDSVTCYEITIRSAAVHPRVTRIRGSSIYLSTIRFTWTLFTTLEGGKRLGAAYGYR